MRENTLRCRWQMQQSVLRAAVGKIEGMRKPEDVSDADTNLIMIWHIMYDSLLLTKNQ